MTKESFENLETKVKLYKGIAHDVNNLLSSIFGSLELLRRKLDGPEDIVSLVDNIENCSIRAAELTRGLLSYGKPSKRKRRLNLVDITDELVPALRHNIPKSITLDYQPAEQVEDILANSTEVYQIIMNICVNAGEAIKGEGTVSIFLETVEVEATDEGADMQPGHYTHISIADTGAGIDEETLPHIFEPYFSTKQKETESGLGLYNVYGLVKSNNGHITVESKAGTGTTFDLYFPVLDRQMATEQKQNKIILYADDEEMLRDIISELLESSDFEVIKTANGSQALKVMREEIKVDLLIIDYNMPGMNGIDVVKELRSSGIDMPVILSTGTASLNDSPLLKELNIKLLNKPYEYEELLELANSLL